MKRALTQSLMIILAIAAWACNESDEPTPVELSKPQSITALRKVQNSNEVKFGVTDIKGVVVSDAENNNIEAGYIAVQEEGKEAGILIEFPVSTNIAFKKGEEVTINLDGASLLTKKGEMVVVSNGAGAVKATGRTVEITPKSVSLSDIVVNAQFWGPILVNVTDVNLSGGTQGKFQGEVVLNDGVGSIYSMIQPNAAFSDEDMPSLANSYIGVVRIDGDKYYVNPRSLDDIVLGVTEIHEDFEDATSTSYNKKDMTFKTGSWTVDGAITAATSADLKNGAQSLRVQGTIGNPDRNGIISMNFDVKGVKSLRVSHGIYPASAEVANVNPTTVDVEISRNGGKTYTLLQRLTIDVQSEVLITDEVTVNAGANEDVRFRFVNSSTPFANNNRPRFNMDDVVFKL